MSTAKKDVRQENSFPIMEVSSPTAKRHKVIDLSAEDSDNKLPAVDRIAAAAAAATAADDDDDDDDDVVEIVDPPPPPSFAAVTPEHAVVKPLTKSSKCSHNVDDDDIQVVGTVNTVALPHMRPHCTVYPFKKKKNQLAVINLSKDDDDEDDNNNNDADSIDNKNPNRQYCNLCYCYVCDVPAKDCKEWSKESHHCNASDKDPYWKLKRRGRKMGSFCVRFENALLFKKLLYNLKQMQNDIYIVCRGGNDTSNEPSSAAAATNFCFQMYTANVFQTGIVRVKIPRKDLAAYLCSCSSSQQQQERICVRVDHNYLQSWATMLHKARKLDVILLNMKEGELHIVLENPKGLKVPDPIRIPVQVDQEKPWFDAPDCEIKCMIKMPSARFKQYISFLSRDMGSSGAEFHCDAKSQKVILQGNRDGNDLAFDLFSSTTGPIQRARFHIKNQSQNQTSIVYDTDDDADTNLFQKTLNAFILHSFFKTAAVSPILQICLTKDMKPCEFRYEADPDSSADCTTLSFFLEPGLNPWGADDDSDDDMFGGFVSFFE